MNTLRNCFLAALSLLAIGSCTDEAFDRGQSSHEGREAMVSLSISAAPEANGMPVSRGIENENINEGTAPDYRILDFWLLQFDQTGKRIGAPRYFEMADFSENGNEVSIPIILPTDGSEYRCVLIANTHQPSLNETLSQAATLDELKVTGKKIQTFSDMYNPENGEGDKDLFMNGVVPVTSGTTSLDCQLYRNVAKLTLQLTNNAGSGMKIVSVQLRNVPSRLFYADRLYEGADTPSPTTEESGFIDLPLEAFELNAGDAMKELVYYLPRNCRGTKTGDTESNKNVDAPDFATYLEIMAEDEQGLPFRYRFYLGGNMTNNFNVESNHHYTLPITINGKGDADTDDRVEDLGHVRLRESNSYIINPTSGEAQTVYSVPVSRINKFWYEELKKKEIDPSTEWVAEVIWQDQDKRLINFCTEDGEVTDGNTGYSGKGDSFFRFKPVQGAAGNVVVGVRKKGYTGNEYLWSWHLWITGYDPDYTSPWQEDTYSYKVEGGHVHRYADGGSSDIWEGQYKNKYIMDRNLGAYASTREDGVARTKGMYYQFGRKDPFPSAIQLYDIEGKQKNLSGTGTADGDYIDKVKQPASLDEAVKRPFSFYASGSQDWLEDNPYSSNLWNNPTWNESESGKSLFDPCPPGWKLPQMGAYDIFAATIEGVDSCPNAANYSPEKGKNDFQGGSKNAGWLFYMSATGKGETTWYPASGGRTPSSGGIELEYLDGYCWFATPNDAVYARNLNFISQLVRLHSNYTRSYGFPVRCVQE